MAFLFSSVVREKNVKGGQEKRSFKAMKPIMMLLEGIVMVVKQLILIIKRETSLLVW